MKIKFSVITLSVISLFLSSVTYTQDGKFSQEKIDTLRRKLDEICQPIKAQGIKISAKVMHADYGKILYELDPEIPMIPASITKIIVSACAFYKLGVNYYVPTIVYTDDSDIKDGVINGNLYLKGFGDPDLNSGDIAYLAGELVKKGIKEITGNIVADESYFDKNYYNLRGVYSGDTGPSYWPYVNALALDKNSAAYEPATTAASLLSSNLISLGVTHQGTYVSGITPPGAKEVVQVSHSLYDILSNLNKESDNHSALTIFKMLGAKFKSNPASLEDGQSVIIDFLTEIGVDRYSYEILEGSGLTRYNRVNAEVYMKLLKFMYDDLFLFDYFLNSLTIAGKDGTLRNRMKGTSAEGNVYAKTGTLNSVSCLAGYVINKDNEILIFYIAMNGHGGNALNMRAAQDDFCIVLSEFSRK
ncbi:MAG: D-alanyl-D-alanine carboxypeptidase/D-alanyl-D-alanine-endopeptidase [Ignavibacteria bacterium]|nr:D-alanyl-D-alanine carboxypeptidase/D-alanyl-D-alanine-endopeptidase [Ignavibacteria bacterium]